MQTQHICIPFVQGWPNVFDVGPTLYKYHTIYAHSPSNGLRLDFRALQAFSITNILCLLDIELTSVSYKVD